LPIFIRRCQVFNTSAGEPVLEIVVKPGMSFLRWFARKGFIAPTTVYRHRPACDKAKKMLVTFK